ncbi:MAG: tetratricopeptide repeat protein [Planctomycetes bacterium]|nr:tetratricopeptide repeat protein [Planctomycetota bacterium]
MSEKTATFDIAAVLESDDLQREAMKEAKEAVLETREQYVALQRFVEEKQEALGSTRSADKARNVSFQLGAALWILGRYREAVDPLETVRTRKEAAYILGDCYEAMGRLDDAEECFSKASRGDQDKFDLSIKLINIRRQKGEADKAIDDLEKLAKKYESEPRLHYLLGRCLDSIGEYESAISSYERALELDEQFAPAAFRLGFIHDLRGNEEEAIKHYEICAEMDRVYPNVLINLGLLYEDQGEYEKAIACYDQVLERFPTHPRARLFKGDAESSITMYYDEEKERSADRRNAVLDIPITDFELSVRSRNCLDKMRIRTLGDLTRVTEQQLLAYKNFGETSLNEIKQIMAQRGLKLGQALEEGEEALDVEVLDDDEEEELEQEPEGLPHPGSLSAEELLARPVGDLQFSVRGRRAMEMLNVKTIGDLIEKTEEDLLSCRNFGQTSVDEVTEKLRAYGLALKPVEE